jgi:hypothetical protein
MPNATTEMSGRWQFGMRAAFLLTALVAVWFAHYVNLCEIARLESRIRSAQPLARELVIDDDEKFAAVKIEELWFDEFGWDVHLPDGEYRLCLATRQIDDKQLPLLFKSAPIKSGKHRIALEWPLKKDYRVAVTVDGARTVETIEPTAWYSYSGSGSLSGVSSKSEQRPTSQPLELLRRRFIQLDAKGRISTPDGPTNGLMVWIEKLTAGK